MLRRSGFTVVEVLVVIALITALAAMLAPSLNKAREAARRAICSSQLRQWGIAHHHWAGDHKNSLVEGQPVYDPAAEGVKGQTKGNSGHYAIWWRDVQWPNPKKRHEYGGRYTKEGALVKTGYLSDARLLYCPSWTVPWIQYRVGGHPFGNPGGGWFDNEADIPGPTNDNGQVWMVSSYHYNSLFGSDDYNIVNRWRSAHTRKDPPSSALAADAFSDPNRGVDFHHVEGYNVLYLGGQVAYYGDPGKRIRDLNGGQGYIGKLWGYRDYQARVWRMFERRE